MSDAQNLDFLDRLRQLKLQPRLPYTGAIEEVLAGETSENPSGFPIISEISFMTLLDEVPHLFLKGLHLLGVAGAYKEILPNLIGFSEAEKISLGRALKVIENVCFTAAVTAPSDLWVLKHVLSSFKEIGISDILALGTWLTPEQLCAQFSVDAQQLRADLALLHSRGWIDWNQNKTQVRMTPIPQSLEVFKSAPVIPKEQKINWVETLADYLINQSSDKEAAIHQFFHIHSRPLEKQDWVPDLYDVELGARLVPLILALKSLNLNTQLTEGTHGHKILPTLTPELITLLYLAGICNQKGVITSLGHRVMERGPGPMGIIHAYHSYMNNHTELLLGNSGNIWVARGENVAASQDANSKSFKKIIDSLNQFTEDHQFPLEVFIEHAVGYGEATRLEFAHKGEEKIQYVGADLEDAAIDKAIESQSKDLLPKNMKFIRNADIGKPDQLLSALKELEISTDRAVMVVGNGFHEVREQTNQKMIQVFQQYCDANLIISFTEESGLSDNDLLETGWNTYHAGFRYVHEISGQGLRPAVSKTADPKTPLSWQKCATLGGYIVLPKYTTRSRTIYPHPKADGYNPSISVNYFCLPKFWAKKLNII